MAFNSVISLASMISLDGYYINLDRSPLRQAAMEAELHKRKLGFVQRFAAVDGRAVPKPGACAIPMAAYGSFLSHDQIIRSASPESCTLILEDDMQLSDDLAGSLSQENLAAFLDYDLVFLDCQPAIDSRLPSFYYQATCSMPNLYVPEATPEMRRRTNAVGVFPAQGFYCWGAAAYLVTPSGKHKLVACLRRTLDVGPVVPLDMVYRSLIEDGTLSAVVLKPFLATPDIQGMRESTIEGREQPEIPFTLFSAIRRMLFAGDISGVREWVKAVVPNMEVPADDAGLLFALMRQIDIGAKDNPQYLTLT